MKTFSAVTVILMGTIFASCSSGPYAGKVQQAADVPLVSRNYVLRDRSHEIPPQWATDFEAYNAQMQAAPDTYFWSDSNNRMAGCNVSKMKANVKISQQISSYVFSEIKDTTEGARAIDKMSSDGSSLKNDYSEKLMQQSKNVLSGVEHVGTVWEERDYTQAGGAASVFTCKTLVKIPKKTLDDSIKKVTKYAIEKLPLTKEEKIAVSTKTSDVSEKEMLADSAAPAGM